MEGTAMRLLFLAVSVGFLSACTTLPPSFTTENIMKVHQGMSSTEILEMFGKPKNVSQSVCGAATGHPWACTTWEYGESPYGSASFTFSGNAADSLILNNFKINRP
jgi:hypothetical protein